MKRAYSLLIFFISITSIFSQAKIESTEITKEIDQQVWFPFIKAYNSRDWKAFNDLQTDDVLRVNTYGMRMGSEYKEKIKKNFQKPVSNVEQIEFSFAQRIHKKNTAYEIGYYKVTYKKKNPKFKTHFGMFHVVLKKEDGVWRIAQDWDGDSVNGKPITQQDFDRGEYLTK
ncbi:conserved hypothetical protein [Tenacibaculum sp. MAR_2009_124]|uniref:YybH family protein n=1 Tax=Tenacibaculum sp. MAR_2009_124 TaxID=1250059 RepID=UPI00089B29B9|nr:nuclear transport factor 2 family protein [Tenacibaculum sp. MAR_2009_124]SEC42057.1 conserved hypothetical protein [Tenacibaculum sp. MAR_2009_124]